MILRILGLVSIQAGDTIRIRYSMDDSPVICSFSVLRKAPGGYASTDYGAGAP